jgi:hypothetical protein
MIEIEAAPNCDLRGSGRLHEYVDFAQSDLLPASKGSAAACSRITVR